MQRNIQLCFLTNFLQRTELFYQCTRKDNLLYYFFLLILPMFIKLFVLRLFILLQGHVNVYTYTYSVKSLKDESKHNGLGMMNVYFWVSHQKLVHIVILYLHNSQIFFVSTSATFWQKVFLKCHNGQKQVYKSFDSLQTIRHCSVFKVRNTMLSQAQL